MKRTFTSLFALILTAFVLSGCSGVDQEDYEKAVADYNNAEATIESLESEIESLRDELSKLQAEKDILQTRYDNAVATPKPTPEPEEASDGWNTPLPDGLSAKVIPVDDFTLLVWYANETGDDIALATYYAFADSDGNGIIQGTSYIGFIRNGEEYIEVLDSPDPIVFYGLDYDIERVFQKTQEANDALSVESRKNNDGSVTAYFSSADGASVYGRIFFLSDDGDVLGYQSFDIGFASDMDYDFDPPGVEYDDYILCYEATA